MKAAGVLLLLIAHQGHGLGGALLDVRLQWAAHAEMQPAQFSWEAAFAHTELASGRHPMPQEPGKATSLTLALPQVEQRTEVTLNWRIGPKGEKDAEPIATGSRSLWVYPDNILAPLKERLGDRTLAVLGDAGQLSKTLNAAKVPFKHDGSLARLALQSPEILIVPPGQLAKQGMSDSRLRQLARGGTNILILNQPGQQQIAGLWRPAHAARHLRLAKRAPPTQPAQ